MENQDSWESGEGHLYEIGAKNLTASCPYPESLSDDEFECNG